MSGWLSIKNLNLLVNMLSEGAVLSTVSNTFHILISKDLNTRSSNASIMSYDVKIRMLSCVIIMHVTISNKQIIQMKK